MENATAKEFSNLATGKAEGKIYVKFLGIFKIPIDLHYLKTDVVIDLYGFGDSIKFIEEGGKTYVNEKVNYPVFIDYIATGLANKRLFAKMAIKRALRDMNNDQKEYLYLLVEKLKEEGRFFFAYKRIQKGMYQIMKESEDEQSPEK